MDRGRPDGPLGTILVVRRKGNEGVFVDGGHSGESMERT